MVLTIRRTGAADYGQYIKMLVCAYPGAGKTVFGSTSIDPLIVDCEGGLMSIADRRVPYTEIESSLDLAQLHMALIQEGEAQKEMLGFNPGTIVIDTVDEVQKMYERERLRETGREALNMQDFGWLKDRMLEFVRNFRNLKVNVIFLCHLKETTDEESGTVSVKPGLKGAVADEIAAYVDIVGVIHAEEYTDIDGTETVKKSRRVMQVQPDRRHDWLKDRSWKLPSRIPLNGQSDFKRIHATVFQAVPEPSPEATEVPEQTAPAAERIERAPEKPENPIPEKTATAKKTTTADKETEKAS